MTQTKKSLAEIVNETLKSSMSAGKKAQALVKLGVTPYEAMILAKSSVPKTSCRSFTKFTFTFGVEMETINCDRLDFIRAAAENGFSAIDHTYAYRGCHEDISQFKLVPDSSISGANAAECVTPALKGNAGGFKSLNACCNALKMVGATVNKSCGLHVHIGAIDLTDEAYCNVFVNYMYLEKAIESFLAPSRRGVNARWCKSLRPCEANVLNASTKFGMSRALGFNRYYRVNAESYERHNTIEFRQHQGTINYTKISAWVKFLGKLVEWSRSNRLAYNIDRIEEIPFLSNKDKRYFIERREHFDRNAE